MMHDEDHPLDLTPLREEADARTRRIVAALSARIATERTTVLGDVGRRLSRFAIPVTLAAAASIVWLVGARPGGRAAPDPFALAVMGRGPTTRWVMLDRTPERGELLAIVGREP